MKFRDVPGGLLSQTRNPFQTRKYTTELLHAWKKTSQESPSPIQNSHQQDFQDFPPPDFARKSWPSESMNSGIKLPLMSSKVNDGMIFKEQKTILDQFGFDCFTLTS